MLLFIKQIRVKYFKENTILKKKIDNTLKGFSIKSDKFLTLYRNIIANHLLGL